MQNKQDEWVCAHCGYTADGKFKGDICPACALAYCNIHGLWANSLER
jgi:rubrerythrin